MFTAACCVSPERVLISTNHTVGRFQGNQKYENIVTNINNFRLWMKYCVAVPGDGKMVFME
ncbi:MAG: hypothetical protein ACYTXA_14460, partial [Nostoc sp.]